jgi:uncharacterized iron-regulated membrane protein
MESSVPNKPRSIGIRPIHRIIGTILMLFTIYIGTTGLLIQWIDLRAILSQAAATDPEMLAIRESIYGSGNYEVINAADYAAPALPDGYDFNAALGTVLKTARQSLAPDAGLKYLELRVVNGKPIGVVQADKMVRVDAATGDVLPNPPPRRRGPQAPSMHQKFKSWHRYSFLGNSWAWLGVVIGIALFGMIVTGLILYFQLLRARRRAGLNAIFWSAGGCGDRCIAAFRSWLRYSFWSFRSLGRCCRSMAMLSGSTR